MESTRHHSFGRIIDGRLTLLFGTINDEQFAKVAAVGLPPRWVCWHIDRSECGDPPSDRVRLLRELPYTLTSWRDLWDHDMRQRPPC